MFPRQPNQSVIDGLLVLQTLTAAARPIGSRELARQLGLEPTRVNRLAKTLAGLGFLQQAADRKYAVGPGVHVLAAQALHASGLLRAALPALETLHPLGHTVSMGVIWRSQVCYLYHWHPGMSSAEAVGMSDLFPAADSGIGHALLARLAEEEVRLQHPDVPASLLPRLAEVRERGWAFIPRRSEAVVAVALGDVPPAAIALAGPFSKTEAHRLIKPLRVAAAAILDSLNAYQQTIQKKEPPCP